MGDPGLYTAAAWVAIRNCLRAHFGDPRAPPSGRTTDMVQDAGTGLTKVVLWDLVFLAFGQQTPHKATKTTTISTQLLVYLARYSNPDGPGKSPIAWHSDGLAQRL